jgi:chemotaxis protein CheZ
MARIKTEHFDAVYDFLQNKRPDETTLADVLELAEISARSMQRFFADMDNAVYRELREIAGYIESLKREIGALKANEIKTSRIPAAGQELSAVCKATETATNTIMECAEAVMAADGRDPAAYKALVEEKMMLVFEACSFQDITGQRITKVVETLQLIDERVSRFAKVIAARDAAGPTSETERLRAERRQRLILNGPQLDGPETSQSEIDAMFPDAVLEPSKRG